MSSDPAKKPPNSHPRLQEDASSTEGLASRRGCCIAPCMSLFWRHIPTRVPFLSFGEGNRETIELVDSQTRLTKVTLYCYSYLHKEKKIKKIVSRLKPSQNLVSFAFVPVKLSTWRPRAGYLFSPKIHTFKYLSTY